MKTSTNTADANRVGSDAVVSRLERRVKYYERMHADARRALDIAGKMSLEMKEQLIEARQQLERAKTANGADQPRPANGE